MLGYQISRGSHGPNGITQFNATLPPTSGSFPVQLAQPSNQIKIWNYSAYLLYISFSGPATVSSFAIAPGQFLPYDGQALTSFQLNSGGNTINYGVLAY